MHTRVPAAPAGSCNFADISKKYLNNKKGEQREEPGLNAIVHDLSTVFHGRKLSKQEYQEFLSQGETKARTHEDIYQAKKIYDKHIAVVKRVNFEKQMYVSGDDMSDIDDEYKGCLISSRRNLAYFANKDMRKKQRLYFKMIREKLSEDVLSRFSDHNSDEIMTIIKETNLFTPSQLLKIEEYFAEEGLASFPF